MNALPDNVIVLADRRQADPMDYTFDPAELEYPVRPQLRLVTSAEEPEPFSLEVFLRRAMLVLADPPANPDDHPAPLIHLHTPASA